MKPLKSNIASLNNTNKAHIKAHSILIHLLQSPDLGRGAIDRQPSLLLLFMCDESIERLGIMATGNGVGQPHVRDNSQVHVQSRIHLISIGIVWVHQYHAQHSIWRMASATVRHLFSFWLKSFTNIDVLIVICRRRQYYTTESKHHKSWTHDMSQFEVNRFNNEFSDVDVDAINGY